MTISFDHSTTRHISFVCTSVFGHSSFDFDYSSSDFDHCSFDFDHISFDFDHRTIEGHHIAPAGSTICGLSSTRTHDRASLQGYRCSQLNRITAEPTDIFNVERISAGANNLVGTHGRASDHTAEKNPRMNGVA